MATPFEEFGSAKLQTLKSLVEEFGYSGILRALSFLYSSRSHVRLSDDWKETHRQTAKKLTALAEAMRRLDK